MRVASISLYIDDYLVTPAKVAMIVREYLSGFVWCGFLIGRIASMKCGELLSVFLVELFTRVF